jgi:hypothetical protein
VADCVSYFIKSQSDKLLGEYIMKNRLVWLTVLLLIGFIGINSGRAQVENLYLNGGFENGTMAPFTTYGDVTTEVVTELTGAAVPEDPVEGSYALHITVNSITANFWDAGLQNREHNIFEQGKKYTLSAFLKCSSGTLDINFKPELDGDPWTGYGEQSFTMTEEWQEFSITTPIMTQDVNPAEAT